MRGLAGFPAAAGSRLRRAPALVGVGLILGYRYTLGIFWGGQCKYHPSCSQYALDAYREYGFTKGTLLAAWRVLRCNPWSRGGVDQARDQRVFG